MEVRIRLQKMLLDCNRLPQTTMYDELISDISNSKEFPNLEKVMEKSEEATKTLMSELLCLEVNFSLLHKVPLLFVILINCLLFFTENYDRPKFGNKKGSRKGEIVPKWWY